MADKSQWKRLLTNIHSRILQVRSLYSNVRLAFRWYGFLNEQSSRQSYVLNQPLLISLQDSVLQAEYDDLEKVGPAPGQPWAQHERMVQQNLCSRAVANQFVRSIQNHTFIRRTHNDF